MMADLNDSAAELSKLITKIKERIPKEIKLPEIKYEEITVKDVTIVPETVHVIGKIVAKDK